MVDMKKLMKQAQKAQLELNRVQEEIKTLTYDSSVGGGAVKATVNGSLELVSLTIDPSAVDPDDVEMLQDMVCTAVNEALRGMNEISAQRLNAVTGGMGIPGF
ncbi:MAG: YbaB/EbfC family nucleoid-associated protein [Eggerthellaceae bacterium]|nr:YbaB/EbfC family nucleoid-associated protein [Eggerthellaceae bacterium]